MNKFVERFHCGVEVLRSLEVDDLVAGGYLPTDAKQSLSEAGT